MFIVQPCEDRSARFKFISGLPIRAARGRYYLKDENGKQIKANNQLWENFGQLCVKRA
jgi:hypothetical protein